MLYLIYQMNLVYSMKLVYNESSLKLVYGMKHQCTYEASVRYEAGTVWS